MRWGLDLHCGNGRPSKYALPALGLSIQHAHVLQLGQALRDVPSHRPDTRQAQTIARRRPLRGIVDSNTELRDTIGQRVPYYV